MGEVYLTETQALEIICGADAAPVHIMVIGAFSLPLHRSFKMLHQNGLHGVIVGGKNEVLWSKELQII